MRIHWFILPVLLSYSWCWGRRRWHNSYNHLGAVSAYQKMRALPVIIWRQRGILLDMGSTRSWGGRMSVNSAHIVLFIWLIFLILVCRSRMVDFFSEKSTCLLIHYSSLSVSLWCIEGLAMFSSHHWCLYGAKIVVDREFFSPQYAFRLHFLCGDLLKNDTSFDTRWKTLRNIETQMREIFFLIFKMPYRLSQIKRGSLDNLWTIHSRTFEIIKTMLVRNDSR